MNNDISIENDNPIWCQKLLVSYKHHLDFMLTFKWGFMFDNLNITVDQRGVRTITIISEKEENAERLYDVFVDVEKLLMIFDGRFYPLDRIEFSGNQDDSLERLSDTLIHTRLSYYDTESFSNGFVNRLVVIPQYSDISGDTVKKWREILDEAGIMHQVFLYMMIGGVFTNDLRIAFLIETAEPMIELIKEHTVYFTSLTPGKNGTTLKMCIDGLITTFGRDIFDRELQSNYSDFLQRSVDSRIRIMHIKKNYNKAIFNSMESVLYLEKYNLLYRRIMLELLGITYDSYSENLNQAVRVLEKWYDISKRSYQNSNNNR